MGKRSPLDGDRRACIAGILIESSCRSFEPALNLSNWHSHLRVGSMIRVVGEWRMASNQWGRKRSSVRHSLFATRPAPQKLIAIRHSH